jgi:hypothetical protein
MTEQDKINNLMLYERWTMKRKDQLAQAAAQLSPVIPLANGGKGAVVFVGETPAEWAVGAGTAV